MVAMATFTYASGVAAVVEAREARRVPVVAQGAADWTTLAATTGAVAAALAEATDGGGTAREEVQHETASQPPPLVFGLEHVTVVAGQMHRKPWLKENLCRRLSRSCCVC